MFNQSDRNGFNPAKIGAIVLFFVGVVFGLGAIVMFLWNAILPEVANVKPLNLWQAIGLLILSKILFGGMRWGDSNKGRAFRSKRGRWKEKWMNMTPEEREAMKERWKKRCR